MKAIPIVNPADRNNAIIASLIAMLLLFLYLLFSTIEMADPAPSDIEPIKTETTLQEIELKQYVVETEAGGSRKGGSGTNDPISDKLEQTEQILTSEKGKTTVNSGKSTHHNSPNSENSSATNKSGDDDFFGDDYNSPYDSGGDSDFGDPSISKGSSSGGIIEGSGRIRLNNPDLSSITVKTDKNTISLILTVNKNGDVTKVELNQSKTTVTDAITINKVKNIVKGQVKYNKVTYDNLARTYLTVTIKQE
jgi:hypothetical protein